MHLFSYLALRIATFPVIFLPYKAVHRVGKVLGSIAYYLMPSFRKRALCNLSYAGLADKYAKESFQNLMINCLEYAKLAREKDISKIAVCENPEVAQSYIDKGQGVIFFCGHQSNWEILFLEGTTRMPGVAIGRPIKNRYLYNWVLKMRQKFGGKIVPKEQSVKEGLRALKKGMFLGIVGDQGMPDSGYSSPFFGRIAWTSPLPALLSQRTGAPVFVATTRRERGKYIIHYSDPIMPCEGMMERMLGLFEESVRKSPGEWLWQHNRWKQQSADKLKRKFRHETIAVISEEEVDLQEFRQIYPTETIKLFTPEEYEVEKMRYKLVFNLTSRKVARKDAFTIINLSRENRSLTDLLTECRISSAQSED